MSYVLTCPKRPLHLPGLHTVENGQGAGPETKIIQIFLDEGGLVLLLAGVRLPPYHGVPHLHIGLVHEAQAGARIRDGENAS